MHLIHAVPSRNVAGLVFASLTFVGTAAHRTPTHTPRDPAAVTVKMTEWKVMLSQGIISTGPVTFTVTNAGSIPHAFEVEGQGIEQKTDVIQPGSSVTLTLTLKPGNYEVYCPVGEDSHKKLGMETHLRVVRAGGAAPSGYGASPSTLGASTPRAPKFAASMSAASMQAHAMTEMSEPSSHRPPDVKAIEVTGGGPVIQILPGPFPFADSAARVLQQFGDEREGLESEVKNGPYSNNVTAISGTFAFKAWDVGAVRDSVEGVAEFTAQDGARWKLVLDRVQTKDVLHHPRFGGVIMGLYYHGNTAVHTPLVPTINSDVALWAFGHLYKNGDVVTDNAMVHVMLLSRTRRDGDFALDCWDCSKNRIEEVQLQILPGKGEPKFDTPGGFLFVNWEKSSARKRASMGG